MCAGAVDKKEPQHVQAKQKAHANGERVEDLVVKRKGKKKKK